SATLAPSPTRKDTSSSSTRSSGRSKRTPATSTCPTSKDCARSGPSTAPALAEERSDALAHRLQDPAYDDLVRLRDVDDHVPAGDVAGPTTGGQRVGGRGRVDTRRGGRIEGVRVEEEQPEVTLALLLANRRPTF